MNKEIRFERADGRVLILTPDPHEPFKYATRFEDDGTTLADEIAKNFEAKGKEMNENR